MLAKVKTVTDPARPSSLPAVRRVITQPIPEGGNVRTRRAAFRLYEPPARAIIMLARISSIVIPASNITDDLPLAPVSRCT